MNTIDTLSLPNQVIDSSYVSKVVDFCDAAVIDAPCGSGKTLATAEYMAEHFTDNPLFVAERVEQLSAMRHLLVEKHRLDPHFVGLYVSGSDDLKALQKEGRTKPIALVTQARIMCQPPHEYIFCNSRARKLMIVDESCPPLVILRLPKMFVAGFLREMNLHWSDLGMLPLEEVEVRLAKMESVFANHARSKFEEFGIRYLDWTNAMADENPTGVKIKRHAYYLMFKQILLKRYMFHKLDVSIILPMAPHLSWREAFEKILVLDGTARLTPYLYHDFQVLTPGTWNYGDIEECRELSTDIGAPSRSKIQKYPEVFLESLDWMLPYLNSELGYENPYTVTYKTLEGYSKTQKKGQAEYLPGLIQARYGFTAQHYGNTRGSNAYRDKSSVILLGSYRTPPDFDHLATMLYPTFDPFKQAAAVWVQELYRSRIRNYRGEKIRLAVLGEQKVVDQLRQVLGRNFGGFGMGVTNDLERYEQFLQGKKKQTRLLLLQELRKSGHVNVKEFAKMYTDYHTHKVWRALEGLLRDDVPQLKDHIVGSEGDECISLKDKKPFE